MGGSNNCNWQGQIPCPPVYVRWAYSQTPQIPLSKHNHMVSQLLATSCATLYLALAAMFCRRALTPLYSNLINPLQWGQNSLRVKQRFLLGFYQSENCVHRGWLHNWNEVNLNFMIAVSLMVDTEKRSQHFPFWMWMFLPVLVLWFPLNILRTLIPHRHDCVSPQCMLGYISVT